MPLPAEILDGVQRAARQMVPLAGAWHAVLFASAILLARGVRPSRRAAGLWLAAPLASVSAVAAFGGNPFNAIVVLALAAGLATIALRLPGAAVAPASDATARIAGAALLALGWLYPHFLDDAGLYVVA